MTHWSGVRLLRRALLMIWLVLGLAACASGPREVSHSFSFDGLSDHWAETVDLLAYAYGDGYHMVREDLSNPSSSASCEQAGVARRALHQRTHAGWRVLVRQMAGQGDG